MRSKKIYLSFVLVVAALAVSVVGSVANAALPAKGTWFSYGLINYNGKTFQKQRISEAGNAIFYPTNEIESSTRPECINEAGEKIHPATIELSVPNDAEPGTSATVRTYYRNSQTCDVKQEKNITLEKNERRNKVFILNTDADTITTWNNLDENVFHKIPRSEFSQGYASKPGWDIYKQGENGTCQDTIVKNPAGNWYVLPMQDDVSHGGIWGWESGAHSAFYASLFVDEPAAYESAYWEDCSLGGHKLADNRDGALGYKLGWGVSDGEVVFKEGRFRHKDTCGDDDNNFLPPSVHRIDSGEFDREIEGWDDGNTSDSSDDKNKEANGDLENALVYIQECENKDGSHAIVSFSWLSPYSVEEITAPGDQFVEAWGIKAIPTSSPDVELDGNAYRINNGVAELTQDEIDGTDDAVDDNGQLDLDDGGGDCEGEECDETDCAIEKVGWIVCPALELTATITDTAFNFLADNFLETEAELVKTGEGTYKAWQVMRDFANAAFVIAFLIIIYSQLTSAGISNYGIKKMMPRLLIAAVLVNASFVLCQLAVDLTNILGWSLKGLLDSIAAQVGPSGNNLGPSTTGDGGIGLGILQITVAILAAAAIVYILLPILGTILLTAIITLVTIIIILLLRKALIILLIFISPLAFVAYLLPNTEKLFDKWKDMFIKLLLVFPIISLLFGAGTLAGQVLLAAGGSDESSAADLTIGMVAAGVTVAPLLAVWSVMQGALAAAGAIGGKIAGGANKVGGFAGGSMKDRLNNNPMAKARQIKAAGRQKQRDENFAERIGSSGFRGRMYRGLGRKNGAGKKHLQNAAYDAANKADEDEVSAMTDRIGREAGNHIADAPFELTAQDGNGNQVKHSISGANGHLASQLHKAIAEKDHVAARAAMKALMAQEGGAKAIQKVLQANKDSESFTGEGKEEREFQGVMATHVAGNRGTYDSKDGRISQFLTGAGGIDHLEAGRLTQAQLGSQTGEALRSSNLTREQAQAVLANKDATASSKQDTTDALNDLAK